MNKLLLALGTLAAGLVIYKTAFAATTVDINGHTWKLEALDGGKTNVKAPKGSWGPHEELLVLQFVDQGGTRVLSGVGQGVPDAMRVAALKDLNVKVPGT